MRPVTKSSLSLMSLVIVCEREEGKDSKEERYRTSKSEEEKIEWQEKIE